MATDEPQTMNKDLQRTYLQMQLIEQQTQQLQKQIHAIDQQTEELENVKTSLEQLQGIALGTEMFVPFAGGIFVKAELKDNKSLLINVGAGTAVTKSAPDTIETVSQQISEMGDLRQQMVTQLDRLVEKAREIEKAMEKMA